MTKSAKTYTRPQMMALLTYLCGEEQHELLKDVIRSFPSATVLSLYRSVFRGKRYMVGRQLLHKPPEDVQFEDIIEALPALLDREKHYVRSLVESWLNRHVFIVRALLDGTALPVDTDGAILTLAECIVNDPDSVARSRGATFAAFRDQQKAAQEREETLTHTLRDLRSELALAQTAQAGEPARLGRAISDTRAALETEFSLERASLEVEHTSSLRALETRAQTAEVRLVELAEMHAATLAARDAANAEQLAAHQRAVQDLQQRIAEVRRSQRGAEMAEVERLKQDLASAQVQVAARLDPQVLAELEAAHAHELARLRNELEVAVKGTHTTVDLGDLLDEALIINYPALGDSPADRLADAIVLYRALLAHDLEGVLVARATNAGTLRDAADRDLVVVGVEQLLEDAASLSLDRVLRLTSVRREAQLHQLIHRVVSPRLEGHA